MERNTKPNSKPKSNTLGEETFRWYLCNIRNNFSKFQVTAQFNSDAYELINRYCPNKIAQSSHKRVYLNCDDMNIIAGDGTYLIVLRKNLFKGTLYVNPTIIGRAQDESSDQDPDSPLIHNNMNESVLESESESESKSDIVKSDPEDSDAEDTDPLSNNNQGIDETNATEPNQEPANDPVMALLNACVQQLVQQNQNMQELIRAFQKSSMKGE